MRPNRLRASLDANEPTISTHILSTWPTLVELIGDAGHYDYVEFTAEYAPFTMADLDNLGRAMELKNLAGMIKIEQTQYTHQAMRAIGSGFQSVLFADLRGVADAEACVAAVRAEKVRSHDSPLALSSSTMRVRRIGSGISRRNGPTDMSVRSFGARREPKNECCNPPRRRTLNAQSRMPRLG